MSPSALAKSGQNAAYEQWLQRVEALLPTSGDNNRVIIEVMAKGRKHLNRIFL